LKLDSSCYKYANIVYISHYCTKADEKTIRAIQSTIHFTSQSDGSKHWANRPPPIHRYAN